MILNNNVYSVDMHWYHWYHFYHFLPIFWTVSLLFCWGLGMATRSWPPRMPGGPAAAVAASRGTPRDKPTSTSKQIHPRIDSHPSHLLRQPGRDTLFWTAIPILRQWRHFKKQYRVADIGIFWVSCVQRSFWERITVFLRLNLTTFQDVLHSASDILLRDCTIGMSGPQCGDSQCHALNMPIVIQMC